MDNVVRNTESVFVSLSTNGTGMSVCSNGLTVLDLLPEGTLKSGHFDRFLCIYWLLFFWKNQSQCTPFFLPKS